MHCLTEQELNRLLEVSQKNQKHHLMILSAYLHGLRASETVNLTPENFNNGHITVNRLKNSNKTTQVLLEKEKGLIEEYIKQFGETDRIFKYSRIHFWRIMQKYGEEAGIPKHKRHPHILKHTCAKRIIGKGIDVTKQWLGHKSMSSTAAYLKTDDDEAGKAVMTLL